MTKQNDPHPEDDSPLLPPWFPGPLALLAWALLALALIKPALPLTDQATGRHLTNGQIILEQGKIPQTDQLGFLYSDREYLNFEWLFDVGARLVFNHLGLGILVFLTFVVFTLTLCVVLRHLLENGVSLPVALAGSILLASANYVHLLTRPVIFTYFFLAMVVYLWTRVLSRTEGRSGWLLPLIFLFWANLHPGFASGLLFMGLALLGAMWDERRLIRGFEKPCLLLGISFLGTLFNPYGWHLHTLVLHQVFHSKSLAQVQEFLPPDFAHPNGAVFALMLVLVSGLVLGLRFKGKLLARDILPVLVFLFFALRVQRHILLFLPVVILPFCRVWDEWLLSILRQFWQERCERYQSIVRQAQRETYWICGGIMLVGLVFLLVLAPRLRIGTASFSPASEQFIREHLPSFQRPFTSTIQAGNLLFYFYPQLKVSFDDRVDFYQDEDTFAHLGAVNGEAGWREFLEIHAFDSALLYPTDLLASHLKQEPGWTELYSDAGLVVFKKNSGRNRSRETFLFKDRKSVDQKIRLRGKS